MGVARDLLELTPEEARRIAGQCRLCPGLEALANRHHCERIVLQGRRVGDVWEWVADVITEGADGHLRTDGPQAAIEGALRQVLECEGPSNNQAY